MVLTDTAIRKSKPREKPYKVSDSQGLYLLVNPGGCKLWKVKYRINGVNENWSLAPTLKLRSPRHGRHGMPPASKLLMTLIPMLRNDWRGLKRPCGQATPSGRLPRN